MPVTASDRDASRESCMYLFNDEGEVGSKWLNGEENNKTKKKGGGERKKSRQIVKEWNYLRGCSSMDMSRISRQVYKS